MSFREAKKIGKPGVGKVKPSGLIYKLVFDLTGFMSNNEQMHIIADRVDEDYAINIPDGNEVIIRASVEAFNVSTGWSTGQWDGRFILQFGSPFEQYVINWEFQESASCVDPTINREVANYFESQVEMNNDARISFVVDTNPTVFTTCQLGHFRGTVFVALPTLNESQVSLNTSTVEGLVSIEKL